MKSSNTQILEDLRRYRQTMLKITSRQEEIVENILRECAQELLEKEIQRRKEYIEAVTRIVNNYEEQLRQKERILQEIKTKEASKQAIQKEMLAKKVATATAVANRERDIAAEIAQNFEDQITASRIRDTKNTLGQNSLGGKTLEMLLEEEKNLQQKKSNLCMQVPAEDFSATEKIKILDAELSELQKQNNKIDREIKQDEKERKQYFQSERLSFIRKYLKSIEDAYHPDGAMQEICTENLLVHLTPENRSVVEAHMDALSALSANASLSGFELETCSFNHLFRLLCTSFNHSMRGAYACEYTYAKDLGPSVVADELLEKILHDNGGHVSQEIYTNYLSQYDIAWNSERKEIVLKEQDGTSRQCGFLVATAKVLDALEHILTEDPNISFPDLAIHMSKAFPDSTMSNCISALEELKRLYEETPEQVLITEQRYYKKKELEQMKENARLEREEIARQAELDRENAAYLAEQERRERERQAEREWVEARQAAAQAERQQAAHDRAMERAAREQTDAQRREALQAKRNQERAAREAHEKEMDARQKAQHRCSKCSKRFACSVRGNPNCGAFEPDAIFKH